MARWLLPNGPLGNLSTTMASTPSASALSAVLRCRGNILTRNPPTKRPATTAAYSLGLAAERTRSNQASAWETFLRGERVAVGKRLSVAYAPSQPEDRSPRERDPLSQSRALATEDAHPAAPGGQNALVVRQLARKLISNLPGNEKSSHLLRIIKHDVLQLSRTVLVQDISGFPNGLLKVSISLPRSTEKSGQILSLVSSGWSTLKNTCLFLTALVSEMMFLKLCSAHTVTHPLMRKQEVESKKPDALQVS